MVLYGRAMELLTAALKLAKEELASNKLMNSKAVRNGKWCTSLPLHFTITLNKSENGNGNIENGATEEKKKRREMMNPCKFFACQKYWSL